jgi:hypothetical protein
MRSTADKGDSPKGRLGLAEVLRRGRGSPRIRRGLGGAILLLTLVEFRPDLQFLFVPDPTVSFALVEDLSHGVLSRWGRVSLEGVSPGSSGFLIPPGGRGTLRYEAAWAVEATPWVRLELSAFVGARVPRGRVSLSVDGGRTYRTLAENRMLRGAAFEVGPLLQGRRQLSLLFEGENSEREPLVLVKRIGMQIFAGPPSPAPPWPRAVPAFFLFGLGICLFSPAWKGRVPLLGILTIGFLGRYLNFLRVVHARLEPDAESFRILAERLVPFTGTGFYSGSFDIREPFFLLVAKGAFALLGTGAVQLRLVSLGASMVAIGLSWRLGRHLLGERWAWLPAAGMALSVPMIVESGRGLRLEMELVLLLLFADLAFAEPRLRPPLRFALAGALGGALVLTRSTHLPGLVVLGVLAARRWERDRWRRVGMAGLGLAILVGLYAPHAAALYRARGDPFFDQAQHARWFANVEFAGQPGFPTREEVARDAYTGPRITFWEYLFRLHTLREVAVGYLRGTGKILFHMDLVGYLVEVEAFFGLWLGWLDWALRLLGWAGMLAALRTRDAWLPIGTLALILPVAFPYDRGVTETYRLTLVAFPFFLCGIGVLVVQAAALVGGRSEEVHA